MWAARRAAARLGSDEPVLALICVAMFGLVVSPVSWSHHWVWALPTVLVTAVLAYRHRACALGVVSAAGVALMVWTPITLMPEHQETAASLWRQLAGGVLRVVGAGGDRRGRHRGGALPPERNRPRRRRRAGARSPASPRPTPASGLRLAGSAVSCAFLDVGGVEVDVLLTGRCISS